MRIGRLEVDVTPIPTYKFAGCNHVYFGNNERCVYGRFFHLTFYFTKKRKVSNISGFTTEELKEELKMREAAEKALKEEKRKTESTCRNCAFLLDKGEYTPYYCCSKRTYTIKKYNRICNYKTSLSKTCENFERKEN